MIDNIPVPKEVLADLLEREIAVNTSFPEGLALAHLMLDWVNGTQRSYRDYGDIWGWSSSKVGRHMPDLYDRAEEILSFRAADPTGNRDGSIDDDEEAEEPHVAVTPSLFPGMPETPPKGSKKSKKKKDHKSSKKSNQRWFEKQSWQYKFSAGFYDLLTKEGIATEKFRKDPIGAIQDGAQVFDKLERLDGHDVETIRSVVRWLFREDDFWIAMGNVQSPKKLRRKDDNDQWYFDRFLNKMKAQTKYYAREKNASTREEIADSARQAMDIVRSRQTNG